MEKKEKFCLREDSFYNTKEFEECDYTKEGKVDIIDQKENVFGFGAIYGTVVNVEMIYKDNEEHCTQYYDLSIQTQNKEEVHFILSGYTLFVDCFYYEVGMKVVGFFDTGMPMPLIYPPRYQIRVIALDLPGRMVKADFFDCFLVSLDKQLQLEITNNTYIINETLGIPYCENISNKYLTVLYSKSTRSIPALTQPNVIIVLR